MPNLGCGTRAGRPPLHTPSGARLLRCPVHQPVRAINAGELIPRDAVIARGVASSPNRQPMGERTLILLRHAKSDWSGDEADLARPLAKRGRRQAPEAGRWLAENIDGLDLALVSPALRTRSTWDLVAAELDVPPRARIDDRVYAASDHELLAVVRELSDDVDTVVVVGHNPGIEDLVLLLTGEWTPMPTSALAVITVSGSWSTAAQHPAALRASGRPPAT